MAKPYQVRGMLLEEAILQLLRRSGYRPVLTRTDDPTLSGTAPALRVRGRGDDHQIDAIADFDPGYPLLNPQRLLVEAKAYDDDRRVGIDRVRNGVGVLTDVAQFFFGRDQAHLSTWRYHYRYAIVSTSPFTADAQRYAFAHDISLIPLGESTLFRPIRDALFEVTDQLAAVGQDVDDLAGLRVALRQSLQEDAEQLVGEPYATLVRTLRRYDGAILGMIARRVPVLLVPAPDSDLADLRAVEDVEMSWNTEGWYLRRSGQQAPWFSFDLPDVILRQFVADDGALGRAEALAMKEGPLREIHGFVRRGDTVGVVVFRLEPNWLEHLRQRLE